MVDTAFQVPPDKVYRLAVNYRRTLDKKLLIEDDTYDSIYLNPPSYCSGGGGLVSTISDYFRFCCMLLNGGELDGVRILSPKTTTLMTRDHLVEIADRRGLGSYDFGLGFGVALNSGVSGSILTEGAFGWGGLAHTGFWVDPQEELIGIFLIQILPASPLPYRDLFKPVVYQAVVN